MAIENYIRKRDGWAVRMQVAQSVPEALQLDAPHICVHVGRNGKPVDIEGYKHTPLPLHERPPLGPICRTERFASCIVLEASPDGDGFDLACNGPMTKADAWRWFFPASQETSWLIIMDALIAMLARCEGAASEVDERRKMQKAEAGRRWRAKQKRNKIRAEMGLSKRGVATA